jgi:DNA-binding Xre family transcriptional regulator
LAKDNIIEAAALLGLFDFEKIFHLRPSLEERIMITPADKKVLKKFGENLRRLRKEKGLSLREMSYACSIDNSKIAKIEKGMINITFTTLLQLASALEIHPSALLDYELE